jgi:hypothetical protein
VAGSAGLAAPSAAALEAPAGWSLSRRGALSVLVPPERDSRNVVLLVPAAEAASGEQAVARLWRELEEAPPPLQAEAPLPDALGWVERRTLTYTDGAGGADAGRSVTLLRQRSATHWSLVLQDLSAANAERRDAAVQEVVGSMEAPGYQRESFASRRALFLEGARLAALRAFVEGARRELQVPRVALAILQKDRVVLAEGFGERKLGEGQRPDADTLFMVASTTKPLTSLMAARLVDQGRLAWSAPVRPLLPQLQLADPAAADQLQVRHLFCACSAVCWSWSLMGAPRRKGSWPKRCRPQGPSGRPWPRGSPCPPIPCWRHAWPATTAARIWAPSRCGSRGGKPSSISAGP